MELVFSGYENACKKIKQDPIEIKQYCGIILFVVFLETAFDLWSYSKSIKDISKEIRLAFEIYKFSIFCIIIRLTNMLNINKIK